VKKDMKGKLYLALKTGPKNLDEFQQYVGKIAKKEIAACLDTMIKDGWVERIGSDYKLKYIFDEPIKERVPIRDWIYEKIQSTYPNAQFQDIEGSSNRPASYMNPFVFQVPQCDQGDRGTCVGFAGRYLAWLLQLKLVDPPFKPEEVAKITEDVLVDVWGKCKMLTDTLHTYAPSAQGIYDESRRIENVTYPSGSYIRGAIRALKDYGYNFEKDRVTSRSSTCAPKYFPIIETEEKTKEMLDKQAREHRIDGYAQITTWDGLKDAIWNYGCALIAINIYENFESNGKKGPFADPKGSVIGSHALCAVGYDENYIYFLHSWRQGWSKLGGISEKYYNKTNETAYAPIDSEDVIKAKEMFGLVNVKCKEESDLPVNCVIYIGTQKFIGHDVSASIPKGTEIKISAEPISTVYTEDIKSQIITLDETNDTIDVTFIFKRKCIMLDFEQFFQKINEIFKKLFNKT